jgi:hypothetical protein
LPLAAQKVLYSSTLAASHADQFEKESIKYNMLFVQKYKQHEDLVLER